MKNYISNHKTGLITVGTIMLCIILFVIWGKSPRKYAVDYDKIDTDSQYIIVEYIGSTVAQMQIVEGTEDENKFVRIKSDFHDTLSDSVVFSRNLYIYYGKFCGKTTDETGTYHNFKAYDWDIIYPIKRGATLFRYSSEYLCNFDFIR